MGSLATGIALLAVAIAFGQWWTARQAFVLNLFEKRFQVFLDVRRVASEATQLGKVTDAGLPNEILARGRFLFDSDVINALKHLHTLTIELEVSTPLVGSKINQHFNAMIPLFEGYLSLPQRPPLTALKRIVGQ